MMLTTLRHGRNWNFLCRIYKIKGSKCEVMVIPVEGAVLDVLYREVDTKWEDKYSMKKALVSNYNFNGLQVAWYERMLPSRSHTGLHDHM